MTSLPIFGYNVIMSKQWIGIVGKNGSGKSTVCEHLKSNGFHIFSLSDVVRDYATSKGLGHDRDTLTQLANELKQEHGRDYFAHVLLTKIQDQGVDKVVFDSVRHPDELMYLKRYQVFFIGVDASVENRYQRITQRGKQTDFVSFDDFKRQDSYESVGDSYGQSIVATMALCHVTINNDSHELCNLLNEVDDIIKNKVVVE